MLRPQQSRISARPAAVKALPEEEVYSVDGRRGDLKGRLKFLFTKVGFDRPERAIRFGGPLLAGMLATFSVAAVGHAASFTVDNNEDKNLSGSVCTTLANQGLCTLRTAMRLASNTAGSHTIRLVGKAGNKNFKILSGLPAVTNTVVITGDGGHITKLWGPCKTDKRTGPGHCEKSEGLDRAVFQVDASGSLTLADLSIQNGWAHNFAGAGGGSIFTRGTLELDRVTIAGGGTHDGAGAIFVAGGNAFINSSTIRENTSHHGPAGGIYVAGGASLTVMDSTISGNDSRWSDSMEFETKAGGINNDGFLAISTSTIAYNSITKGEILAPFTGEAGGIANRGEVWMNAVTIAGNTVLGVKNFPGGRFFTVNSLIAANGNKDISEIDSFDCLGTLTTLRGNTIGDPGRKMGTMFPCNLVDWDGLPAHKITDQVGRNGFADAIPVDDIFKRQIDGILDDTGSKLPFRPALENDGGFSCTVPLCSGRLDNIACRTRNTGFATNSGWPSWGPANLQCPAQDQKTAFRMNTCDSGAYEMGPLPEFISDTLECAGRQIPPP
jgi:hypothetical protein